MLTPKQAADLATRYADAAGVSTATEKALDACLLLHGRAALSCSATPPLGALIAAGPAIMELERRYRAAGWVTKLDSGTLWIEMPAEPVAVVSSRRSDGWHCRACGAVNGEVDRCLACRARRPRL